MSSNHNRSVTLLELLIAIALISVVAIGLTSIDLFSRYHVLTSDRRVKLQNEVSYAIDHMTKEVSKAIGDANNPPILISIGGNSFTALIDANQNGRRDASPPDRIIDYVYKDNISSLFYFPDFSDKNTYEILSKHISNFTVIYQPGNNYIEVSITACWDPDATPIACGTPDNPNVTMRARIKMPSVSTH